jgi:hypothetical protein
MHCSFLWKRAISGSFKKVLSYNPLKARKNPSVCEHARALEGRSSFGKMTPFQVADNDVSDKHNEQDAV